MISVDGTCRPQFVADERTRRRSRQLLREARRRWGVGAVLNTSFNIHGEPLVCSPAEAVDVFLRSGADALAIGPFLVDSSRMIARSPPTGRRRGARGSRVGLAWALCARGRAGRVAARHVHGTRCASS